MGCPSAAVIAALIEASSVGAPPGCTTRVSPAPFLMFVWLSLAAGCRKYHVKPPVVPETSCTAFVVPGVVWSTPTLPMTFAPAARAPYDRLTRNSPAVVRLHGSV